MLPMSEPLHLQASWSGRILTLGSPGLLVGLGGYGTARGGLSAPGFWLLLVGLGVLVAAVAALPWATTIDAHGVHHRTLVRRRLICWDDVVAFERHRSGRSGGALVVRTVDGRRAALSDQPERPADWDRLRELVDRAAPGVAVAPPPPLHPFNR